MHGFADLETGKAMHVESPGTCYNSIIIVLTVLIHSI